jgi:hypothetical protein
MTPEAWATNLGALGAATYAGWQSYQAKKAAKEGRELTAPVLEETREAAQAAAERSLPTANGYARATTEALARIEQNQRDDRKLLVDHIQDHARSDVTGRR